MIGSASWQQVRWRVSGALLAIALALVLMLAGLERLRHRAVDAEHYVEPLPGMTVEQAPAPQRGLIVTSVRDSSQAQQSGVAVGDIVVVIDGRPVHSLGQARLDLQKVSGEEVTIGLLHDGTLRYIGLQRAGGMPHGT